MLDWIHAGPSVTTAFLGSLVECVEAATIVLAVGTVRGWRGALVGAAGGLAVLTRSSSVSARRSRSFRSPSSSWSLACSCCCSG